jgi:metal-responsive CopG/Arc/MetJ family transcriptional regulator
VIKRSPGDATDDILGYTHRSVKVAVSIPNPLFEAADQLATHRKASRSQLYAEALELLLATAGDTDVTARLDLVYAAQPTRHETHAKRRVIAVRESW